MSEVSREELKKADFLRLKDSSEHVLKVISPNPFQIGVDDNEFKSALITKGPIVAEAGITGSLMYVSDGVDFLQAGSNISVTKNSNGSLTIAATGFPSTSALSLGNGLQYDSGATYDGTVAKTLTPKFVTAGGVNTLSSAGIRVDFDNLNAVAPVGSDLILFGDISNGISGFPRKCTVNDILSLGSPVTVTNAITLGYGIKDSAASAGSWNNSAAVTLKVDTPTDGGLNFNAGGQLIVDPNQATSTTTVDLVNDFVLIYDANVNATRKVALQYIAGVSPSGLTLGNGLTPNGTAYDGSGPVTAAVLPADVTIDSSATGIKVLKVPNTLSDGVGIQVFSYDGSSALNVAVDRATAGGLNFDGSNKLQLDVNNMSAGAAPSHADEIAVSFGANVTRKVDLGAVGSLITKNFKSSGSFNVPVASEFVTTASVSFAGTQGFLHTANTGREDTYFYVSGSVGKRGSSSPTTALFGGDLTVSGSLFSVNGVSGSLTTLTDGSPYLIAGSNITLSTSSAGAVTITASGGGGGSTSTFQSGSTSVSGVTTVDTSELGTLNNLGGGVIAITGSIGTAEDGSYTDGLFTDFNPSTPVGTAVDRFNEVLKGLAPGAAPSLDDIDSDNIGTNVKLSFGSTQGIAGYANVAPSTLTSPASSLSDVDINEAYSSSTVSNDVRVAAFTGNTAITGTLNADVTADGVNYPNFAFGNGDQGTLNIFVNNNTSAKHQVDLSSFGSGNSKSAIDGTGFINLSVANDGAFADGSSFSTFKHRTGSFVVGLSDQVNGWNYARITHVIGTLTSSVNYVTWVNDDDSNALTSAGSALDTLSLGGDRRLSGARYNTGGTAEYRIRAENAYRNVYSDQNITFNGTNCSVPSQALPNISHGSGEDESKTLNVTGSVSITADPILNGSISVSANIPHPLKSSLSSVGSQSISGILLYDLSNTSTVTTETFRRENYRLISGSYDAQSAVSDAANVWDSNLHMSGTNAGHEDGLLFYNSSLRAPVQGGVSGDFRNTTDGGSIANGPASNVNYSGITSGTRTFYRYIENNSGGSKSNFSIQLNGSGTIVDNSTSLNTANIHVFLKIPTTDAGFTTGWMDLALPFATGQNGNFAGCLDGSLDSSLNATNNATFGTQSVGSGEYIVIKIETDASWTGNISQISITWT